MRVPPLKSSDQAYVAQKYEVDLFSSKEIDLNPVKKRRQRIEEYDYDDDFLEPFEGETEAVELECKLDNFFIYKGVMTEDPKKVLKKFNNFMAKEANCTFEFETNLTKIYKKDTKFFNLIDFLIFNVHNQWIRLYDPHSIRDTKTLVIHEYIDEIILSIPNKNPAPCSDDLDEYLNQLKEDLKTIHKLIKDILLDNTRYRLKLKEKSLLPPTKKSKSVTSTDSKIMHDPKQTTTSESRLFLFQSFPNIVDLFLDFIVKYLRFYYYEPSEIIKNKCLSVIFKMFPDDCSNSYRIKHFALQKIEEIVLMEGYDLREVYEGKFVRDTGVNNYSDNPYEPRLQGPSDKID